MTEYPPTSPVYAWPLLEGDQPNDWRHVDDALLAVEATVEAVEALAGAVDVSVTGDAGIGVTEPTPDAFVLATRVSADAENGLELRADGLYATAGGGGAVDSVNGETGAVVLDAADVGAATPAALTAAVAGHAALPDAHHAKAHDHTAGDSSGVLTNDEHDGYSQYTNLGADPSTPATNRIRVYARDNGSGVATLYYISESGQVYEIPTLTSGGGGGSGAPANASYITTAAESKLHQETVLGAGIIMSGLLSARPAFGTAGRLYLATDTDLVYRDSGSAWATFASRTVATGLATDPLADAKGDVFAASANDTIGRLAVGSNGQVLTADSTQTLGVKWDTHPKVTVNATAPSSPATGDLWVW